MGMIWSDSTNNMSSASHWELILTWAKFINLYLNDNNSRVSSNY